MGGRAPGGRNLLKMVRFGRRRATGGPAVPGLDRPLDMGQGGFVMRASMKAPRAPTHLDRWMSEAQAPIVSWERSRPASRCTQVIDMRTCPALATAMVLFATASLASPPTMLPLQLLPGDEAIGPAWGDQSSPDLAAATDRMLAVWSDARAAEGKWDIWGIRLGPDGAPLDPVAFVIDEADGSQVAPVVAWNGSHWLCAWLDEGTVTLVRISLDGTVIGPPAVAGTPGDAASLALASDGASWVVAWSGTLAGNAAIRAARVDALGRVLDPGGIEILPETHFMRLELTLAFAGDHYLLAWPESSPDRDLDIVGIRFGSDLAPLTGAPFTIASSPNADGAPSLASNGTSFCLAWKEMDRSGWVNGISATLVDAGGVASQPAGVAVGDRRSWGEAPDVAWDGAQWIVGWTALGVQAARMSAGGSVLDPAGVDLATATGFDVRAVALAATGGGETRAVFVDYRSQRENDIGGAGLSSSGAVGPEHVVSLSIPSQQNAKAVWTGDGWAVAFESHSSLRSRILVSRLDRDMRPIDTEPVEVASGDVLDPGIAWSGERYLITWRDRAASLIRARRLAQDLSFQDAAPIDVMTGDEPHVAALGDVFLVTTVNSPWYWQARDAYAQRIDGASGARLGGLIQLRAGFAWGSALGVAGDRWLMAWEAHQAHDDTIHNIAHAFVSIDGVPSPVSGLSITGSGWGTSGLSIAGDGTLGGIAWSSTRAPSASDGEILMVRVAPDGTLLDPPTGLPVTAGVPREQHAPSLAWNGTEFLVAFQDTRNNPDGVFFFPRSDVYAARVGADGVVRDPGGGFAVEATPVPETQPTVAASRDRSLVVASRLVGGPAGALRLGLRGLAGASTSIPPIGDLRVEAGGLLAWTPVAGMAHDVLRGRLSALHVAGSIADASCLAEDSPSGVVADAEMPGEDDGFYYIVRVDPAGAGTGSYDAPAGSRQLRSRDPDAGPIACADSP